MGWGWARDEASNAGDNVIEGNWVNGVSRMLQLPADVQRVMCSSGSNWLLEDGGSIYVLGPQPRSRIVRRPVPLPPSPAHRL